MNKPLLLILTLLLCGLQAAACDRSSSSENAAEENAAGQHEHEDHAQPGAHNSPSHASSTDWCGGHGLPESMCTKCNPELTDGFQASGDWCEEHGFPESACPTCNPMAPPGTNNHASVADWCGGHGLPESMCTKCNPELTEGFQASGDWCEEHGFPESACPTCNPMTPPGGDDYQAADWCVEHGLPESKCPLCNDGLTEQFQAEGDWCEEHGFPESACPVCNPQHAPVGSVLGGVVQLTPEAVAMSQIRTERARSQASTTSVSVPAEVRLNPDRLAHVSTLVPGQLGTIEVNVGDLVEAGDMLAEIRSVELGQARAALSRTDAMRDVARQELGRQQQLRDERINSERSLLEAELAYEVADAERDNAISHLRVFGSSGGRGPDMHIESPLSGVVIERHATRGENVSPDDTLFVIADRSHVWVIGRVYEQDIANVSTGMSATLEVNAFPGRTWTGTVDYLGATLDEDTRSLPIRVELENPEGLLRAGLFGRLSLEGAGGAGPIATVPEGAVQTVNDQTVIFVPGDREGQYMARTVTVDGYSGGNAQISAGIRGGDEFVSDGAFVLKSQIMRHALGEGCAH